MALHVRSVSDPALEAQWVETLTASGFQPDLHNGVLRLRGVGVAHEDQSVDLTMRLLEMDGHRVLTLQAPIRCTPAAFEVASLACIRGNGACQVAKFDVEEVGADDGIAGPFGLTASLHLYADHTSPQELRVMLYLFLKEVDEVDKELAAIMAGR